jgi:hypothetical protein
MAIVKPSHLVGGISGSINALTFKHTRQGAIVSARVRKIERRTKWTLQAQSRYRAIAEGWRNLTNAQRQSWVRAAQDLTRQNVFGITYPHKPWNLYLEHNQGAVLSGLTPTTDAPDNGHIKPITTFTITFDVITGYSASITATFPTSPSYAIVEGSRPRNFAPIDPRVPGKYPPAYIFKQWVFLRSLQIWSGTSPIALTTQWKEKLFECEEAEPVACRCRVWHPDYWQSPRTEAYTYVTP